MIIAIQADTTLFQNDDGSYTVERGDGWQDGLIAYWRGEGLQAAWAEFDRQVSL